LDLRRTKEREFFSRPHTFMSFNASSLSADSSGAAAADGAAALEKVLITDELKTRPARNADFRCESEALVRLAKCLAQSPQMILTELAETAMRLCRAGSAGISIAEVAEGEEIFRWHATVGRLSPFLGGTMPRHFSPCGVTVEREAPQLMRDPVRLYTYAARLSVPMREVLLVPFCSRDKVVGTVWVVCHDEPPAFDAEDARLVGSLAQFAAAALESRALLDAAEAAQQELRSVGAKLEAALGSASIGTWIWDVPTDRVYADPQFARFFGIDETEADGGPLSLYVSRIHPDDVEVTKQRIEEAVATGGMYEAEYRVRQDTGGERWVIARGRALKNEEGVVTQFPGVVFDITERKQAQLDHEQQQRALWAALPLAVYTVDLHGYLTFFNKAASDLWLREPQLGQDRWYGALALETVEGAAIPPENSPTAVVLREQRSVRDMEHLVVRADGSRRWVKPHADPIYDPDGAVRGVVNVVLDVTEERQARRALTQARDEALAASRAKDDFLAALSHELRTPLNPALLLASEASTEPAYPQAAREDFARIKTNIELEARLIDDLLDLTRISKGLLTMQPVSVDLYAVAGEAYQKIQAEAEQKPLRVEWRLDGARPVVQGDAARLQQVFWNVLKNSVKFTPAGGSIVVEGRVDVSAGNVAVDIRDSGIGMGPDEVERIFEAFVQGSHARERGPHVFGGLGLGLAITRRVMELHGGRIIARSEGRGRGSCFTIEVPLREVTAAPGAHQAAQELPSDGAGAANAPRGWKLLLVEDHVDTRQAVERLLRRRGYHVTPASSGAEARAAVARLLFDLVICDVGLPDMDGYALLAELHRLQPGLPAIALTGYGSDKDLQAAREAGFTHHLTKPVTGAQLDGAIAAIARK
jgi:PAS domain S-box-containing protein